METERLKERTTSINKIKLQFENRIDSAIKGESASSYVNSIFSDMLNANLKNAQLLSEFISRGHIEQNLNQTTLINNIQILCYFSRYLTYKPFERVTKEDILSSLKKPETADLSHKWMGTYNVRRMVLNKFSDGYITKMNLTIRNWLLLYVSRE